MPMTPFMKRFPEQGACETRSVTITDRDDLPNGENGFIELYCDESNCDCRRVMVVVLRPETGWKFWAAINYGWESIEFYQKWAGAPSWDRALWRAFSRSLERAEHLRSRASGSIQVHPAVSWLRAASQKTLPTLSRRSGGGVCTEEPHAAISGGQYTSARRPVRGKNSSGTHLLFIGWLTSLRCRRLWQAEAFPSSTFAQIDRSQ
jgi:hypothetical protein